MVLSAAKLDATAFLIASARREDSLTQGRNGAATVAVASIVVLCRETEIGLPRECSD